jgi:serine/threonine protein kinase
MVATSRFLVKPRSVSPHSTHRDRADRRQDRLVAIKHYTCTAAGNAKADWEKEWKNNLMYEHPHIVPILASVAQGEVYMNFYPLCERDLHALFADDPPKHDPKPVWKQFMGLLSALRHVHCGHPKQFGYHFDIKCQNILVRKGKWMIADLGIAHNKSTDGTSTTGRRPGPEEFGGPETRATRKFDIWGIACVGCIVFAWLLGGAGGVAQFREDRKVEILEPHGVTSILYNFFQKGPDGAVIHPAVEELFSKADDPVSKGVAAILKDMLSIDVKMRPTAEEAEKRFGDVLDVEPLALQLPRGAGSVSAR